MLHAPEWATWLIAIAPTLLILGIVLAIYGNEEPDNAVVHQQEDEKLPESGSEEGRDDVVLTAHRAA